MITLRSLATRAAGLVALLTGFAAAPPPVVAQDYSDRPSWERPRRVQPWWNDQYDPDDYGWRTRRSPRWLPNEGEDQDDEPGDESWRDNDERRDAQPAPRRRPAPVQNDDGYGDVPPAQSADKPEGVSGGARPVIDPQTPPLMAFRGSYGAGQVVIDTNARKLYYVTRPGAAYAYPIGVGREGFSWTGSEKVSRIQDWPDWYPPAEMRKRKPELPERMLGGINNPLGAKAIYLGNTLYRIHGTNDPKSIGRAESSGCFRMLNAHVLHLASLVQPGTQVTVVRSLNGAAVASAPAERPRVTQVQRPQPRRWNDQRPLPRYRTYPWWAYDDPDWR